MGKFHNITLWESSRELLRRQKLNSLVPFDDTTDLYDFLNKFLSKRGVRYFPEFILSREKQGYTLKTWDMMSDFGGNAYRVSAIDYAKDNVSIIINGSNSTMGMPFFACLLFISQNLVLVDGKKYYRLLDSVWGDRKEKLFRGQIIKRIDYPLVTRS